MTGQLKPGQRVPSSRALARDVGLARGTVMLAYEQMTIEGYFVAREGSGTFVSDVIPEGLHPSKDSISLEADIPVRRSELSKRLLKQLDGPDRGEMKTSLYHPFQPGLAPIDVFPRTTLARLANTIYRSIPLSSLGFGDGAGYYPLREALASYLGTTRGLTCTADQIIITTGSQQGFRLACQVLLDEGESIWMEDPGYGGARVAFSQAGQHIVPVPLDEEGLRVDIGKTEGPGARMVYVTPAHQYPSTMTMSLERRLQLIEWVHEQKAWILEDDYDGEFRYQGRPLATLQSLDPHRRVIYMGSLSKVLAPALRIGYLVVPHDLVEAFTFVKAVSDRHTPTILQAVLAKFIEEGHFGRHLRRIRVLCKERQDVLLEAAHTYLKGRIEFEPDPAGLHLIGRLAEGMDDREISRKALERDLVLPAISDYCIRYAVTPALMFGYGSFSPGEIQRGIRRLARVVG